MTATTLRIVATVFNPWVSVGLIVVLIRCFANYLPIVLWSR
jgi:hypothetical protein